MINEADIDIGCDRDTPVSSTHHVDTVSIGGRRLPDEVTVHRAPARVCEVVVPAVIPLSLVLQCHMSSPAHHSLSGTHLVEHHVVLLGRSILAGGEEEEEEDCQRSQHLHLVVFTGPPRTFSLG